jgi:hypothetical protein
LNQISQSAADPSFTLRPSFRGSIQIWTDGPVTTPANFAALIINAEGGVLSSYPAAALAWPPSQYERIWKIWSKVVSHALNISQGGLNAAPNLVIDTDNQRINSYACGWIWANCAATDLNDVAHFLEHGGTDERFRRRTGLDTKSATSSRAMAPTAMLALI